MKLNRAIALTVTSAALLTSITAVESNFASSFIPGNPATAGFFDGLAEQIVPSGMYFEVDGKKFYFGEYSEIGDDAIVYKGSKWEIKYGGKVTAHGYYQTPPWVIDNARRFFGF